MAGVDIRGKAVAALISRPANPPSGFVSLRPFRYTLSAIRERVAFLTGRGAAAVLLVSDSVADSAWIFAGTTLGRGRYNIDSTGTDQLPAQPPVVWLHSGMLESIRSASGSPRFVAALQVESFVYPSVPPRLRVAHGLATAAPQLHGTRPDGAGDKRACGSFFSRLNVGQA